MRERVDVEVVLILPLAVVFKQLGIVAFVLLTITFPASSVLH
jgi:NADH:ubiquinone oxidoreductase subunit 3 (subunit A)